MSEARIWSILESCWGTKPSTRAPAFQIFEALRDDLAPLQAVQYDISFSGSLLQPSLPQELRFGGSNWHALHNPRLPKALMVDLVYENDHRAMITSVRYCLANFSV
jgi:hypothetical protein